MKSLIIISIALLFTNSALADCDGYLKIPQKDARRASLYARDCAIQDRYANLKREFSSYGVNVDEIAEYRVPRFVDRATWEEHKNDRDDLADLYYQKNRETDRKTRSWLIWDTGMRLLEPTMNPFSLFKSQGFNTHTEGYELINFMTMNTVLLLNDAGNDSRDYLNATESRSSTPGRYRQPGDVSVGFRIAYDPEYPGKIDRSLNSMQKTQELWETDSGMKFSEVVAQAGGLNPELASFGVVMQITKKTSDSMFVSFSASKLVAQQLSWLQIFINASIDRYRMGNPLMPPIEFSAFVQKWFVTIHPFSDGNGRTSRAVQDYILATFKMPFAPAGDLQNDALEEYDLYVDNTYAAIEKMLARLEGCASEYRNKKPRKKISFACRTVAEITDK